MVQGELAISQLIDRSPEDFLRVTVPKKTMIELRVPDPARLSGANNEHREDPAESHHHRPYKSPIITFFLTNKNVFKWLCMCW